MPLLSNSELQDSLADLRGEQASDRDVLFDSVCNVDYNGDPSVKGLHKLTFLYHYHDFIRCCAAKHYGTDVSRPFASAHMQSVHFLDDGRQFGLVPGESVLCLLHTGKKNVLHSRQRWLGT